MSIESYDQQIINIPKKNRGHMSTSDDNDDDVLTGFGFFCFVFCLVGFWLFFGWQVSTSVKLEQKNENLFFFCLTQIQIQKFQSILSSSSFVVLFSALNFSNEFFFKFLLEKFHGKKIPI